MTLALSDRANAIKPSATMTVSARAAELRAQGKKIINLSVGEPDFDTPEFIKEAAIKAIHDGFTKYTAADGTPELKDAIINKFKRENDLTFKSNEVIVTIGAKQALFNLAQAVLNNGDEAIVLAPYWVSYPSMVDVAGGKCVFITADIKQRFKITADQLTKAITPKTKLIFINSPSNPSGMAYTADELRALGTVLAKHPQIVIACDDMYEHILWGMDKYVTLLNVCPELKNRCVVVNGVSKAYAMTGWRIGYAGGPADIISGMKKIQSHQTSGACSIAQVAATAALNDGINSLGPMVKAFKERHDFVFSRLKAMTDVDIIKNDGTFYAYPDVSKTIARLRLKDDVEFCNLLLDQANSACVPGSAFGTPGYIRLSYATSHENLANALDQMAKILNKS